MKQRVVTLFLFGMTEAQIEKITKKSRKEIHDILKNADVLKYGNPEQVA